LVDWLKPGSFFPFLILSVSLSYVFFIILVFIKDQFVRIVRSTEAPQLSEEGRLGVSVIAYILSCFLMITQLDDVVLYGGIFIIVYLAIVLGNIVSLWYVSK
jgi:hypothetical protein